MDAAMRQGRDGGHAEHAAEVVQSVARGLAVIQAFGHGRDWLTMAEVAHACQITRAGARRILLTLEELGYVRQNGRHFSLTARVLNLTRGYEPHMLWETAKPHLQSLAETLNETISAGVLEGDEIVYKVRLSSSRYMRVDLPAGTRLPAHLSSMGRVLLSALPPERLTDYFVRAKLTRYTPYTICDEIDLRREIELARERGWCCARSEVDEAVWCVAVPQVDREGRLVAALHASLSSGRVSDDFVTESVVPALQAVAKKITAFV